MASQTPARHAGFVSDASAMKDGQSLFDINYVIGIMQEIEAARSKSPFEKTLVSGDPIPALMVCPLITGKHDNLQFEEARDAWVQSVTGEEETPLFLYRVETRGETSPGTGPWEYMPFNEMVSKCEKGLNPINVDVLFTIYDLCKTDDGDPKSLDMWAASQVIRSRLVGEGDMEMSVNSTYIVHIASRLGKRPEVVKGVHDRFRKVISDRIDGTFSTVSPVTHIINRWAHCKEPEEIMAFADLAETSVAEWKVKAALIIRTWGFAALDRYRPDRANGMTRRGFTTPRPSVVFSARFEDHPYTMDAKFERSKWQWYYLLEVACGSVRPTTDGAGGRRFTRTDLCAVENLDGDTAARRYLRLDNELEYPTDAFKERGNMQFLLECIMVLVDSARAPQTKDITNLAQTPLSEKTLSSPAPRRAITFDTVVTPPIGAVVTAQILPRVQLHIVADDSWRAYCMCALVAKDIQEPPVLASGLTVPDADLPALKEVLDQKLSSPAAAFIQQAIEAYYEKHGDVGELAVPRTSRDEVPSATYLVDLVDAAENEAKESGQVPAHADYKPTDRSLLRRQRGGKGGAPPTPKPQRFDQVPTWFIFKTPLDQLTASGNYNYLFVPARTKEGETWRTVNGMTSTQAWGDNAPRMRLENVSLPHDKVRLLYPFVEKDNQRIFVDGSGYLFHLARANADQSAAKYASPISSTGLSTINEEIELSGTTTPSFVPAHSDLLSSSSNILGTLSAHSVATSTLASHDDHDEEEGQSQPPQRKRLRRDLLPALSVASTVPIHHSPFASRSGGDSDELPDDFHDRTASPSALNVILFGDLSSVTTTTTGGEDDVPPQTPQLPAPSSLSEFKTPAPVFNGREPVRIDKEPPACRVVELNVEKAHLMARLIRPMLTALATTGTDMAAFRMWWTNVLEKNTKAGFMAALELATRSVTPKTYDAFVQSMVHPGLLLSAVSINLRFRLPSIVADLAFANSLLNTQLLTGQYTQFGFLTHVHACNNMECDAFDSAQFAHNVLFAQAVAKLSPAQAAEASVAASAFIDAHIAASTRWRVVSRVFNSGNGEMGDVDRREDVSTLEILDGEKARRELVDVDGAQRTVFIQGPTAFLANQFSWEGSGRGVLHVPAVHLTVPEPLLMPSNGGREAWTRAQETVYVPSTCIITPALASNGRGLATPNMAMAFVNALVERGANLRLGVARRALQRSSTVEENPRVLSSPVDGPATPWGGDGTKQVFMNPMARDILQGLFASERLVDVFIRQRASTEPAQSIAPFPLLVDAIRDAYTPPEAIAPPFIHPTSELNSTGLSQFGRRLAVNTSINSAVSNIICHEFDVAAGDTGADPAVLVAPMLGILASRLETIFRVVIDALTIGHENQPEDVFMNILNNPGEDIPEDVRISVVAVRRVFVLSLSPTSYARVETKAEPDDKSKWVSRRGVRVPIPVPNPVADRGADSAPTFEKMTLLKMGLRPDEAEELEYTTPHSSTFIIVDMHVESAGMPGTVIKVPVFRNRSAALRSYVPWGMPVEAAHFMAIVSNRGATEDEKVDFDPETTTGEDVRVVTVSKEFHDADGSGIVWTPCPRIRTDPPVRQDTCLADVGSMFIGLTPASTCPFDGYIDAIHRAASTARTDVCNNALGKDVHHAWAASAMVMGTQGGWVHDPQLDDQVYDTPDATVAAAKTARALVGTQAPQDITADSMLVCTDVAIGAFAYMAAGGDTAAVSINKKTPTGLCDTWMQHVRSTRGCIAVQARELHNPDEATSTNNILISDALRRKYLFFDPATTATTSDDNDDNDDLAGEMETKEGDPEDSDDGDDDDMAEDSETKKCDGCQKEGGGKGDTTLNASSFRREVGDDDLEHTINVPRRSLPVVKADADRGKSFRNTVVEINSRLDSLPGEDADGFEAAVNDLLEALAPGSEFLAALSRALGTRRDTVTQANNDVAGDLVTLVGSRVKKIQLETRIKKSLAAKAKWENQTETPEFTAAVKKQRQEDTRKLVAADVKAMRKKTVELMGMRMDAPAFVRFLRREKEDPADNNVLRNGTDISLEEEKAALMRVHGALVQLEDIIKNSVVPERLPPTSFTPIPKRGMMRRLLPWKKKKEGRKPAIATHDTKNERREALLKAIDARLDGLETLGGPLGNKAGESEGRRYLLGVAERLLRAVTKANAAAKSRHHRIAGSNTSHEFESIVKKIVDHSIANSGTDVRPPTADAPYRHQVKVRRSSSRPRGTRTGGELKTMEVVATPAEATPAEESGQVRLVINDPTTKTEIVNDENERLGPLRRSAPAVTDDRENRLETENARLIRQASSAKTALDDGGVDRIGIEWDWETARKRFQDRVTARIREMIKLSGASPSKKKAVDNSSRSFILDVLLPPNSNTKRRLAEVVDNFTITSPEWKTASGAGDRAGAGSRTFLNPLRTQSSELVEAQPVFVATTEDVCVPGTDVLDSVAFKKLIDRKPGLGVITPLDPKTTTDINYVGTHGVIRVVGTKNTGELVVAYAKKRDGTWTKMNRVAKSAGPFNADAGCQLEMRKALAAGTIIRITVGPAARSTGASVRGTQSRTYVIHPVEGMDLLKAQIKLLFRSDNASVSVPRTDMPTIGYVKPTRDDMITETKEGDAPAMHILPMTKPEDLDDATKLNVFQPGGTLLFHKETWGGTIAKGAALSLPRFYVFVNGRRATTQKWVGDFSSVQKALSLMDAAVRSAPPRKVLVVIAVAPRTEETNLDRTDVGNIPNDAFVNLFSFVIDKGHSSE